MGFLEDVLKFEWGATAAIGIGAVILAPIILPAAGKTLRPLAKSTIKGGMLLFEKTRTIVAESIETIEDLAAEAKAEVAGQRAEGSAKAGS